METTDINVSTMVSVGHIADAINLDTIFEFITINPFIKGIKYKDSIQGCIKKSKSFYNQMSIVILLSGKLINVKLFSNGKVQVTGIKSLEQANSAIDSLKKYLKHFAGIKKVNVVKHHNLYVDDEHTIYGVKAFNSKGVVLWTKIGSLSENIPVLYSYSTQLFLDNLFRTEDFIDKKRKIYNNNGVEVGYSEIQFIKQRKNMMIKNISYKDSKVYNKWGTEIGEEKIFLSNIQPEVKLKDSDTIFVPYDVFDNMYAINNLEVVNVNYNYKIITEKCLDRTALTNFFIKQGFLVDYDPCGYPGVKVFLFVENDKIISKCKHTATSRSKKCDCIKISIIFFQSGTILVSGTRNEKQMYGVKDLIFRILLKDNIKDILFTPFNSQKISVSVEEDISIEDLF